MNALSPIARPSLYRLRHYAAFRVSDLGRTYPIEIDPADTLDEALNLAVVRCQHKDRLVIKETDEERVTLHIYAVKRESRPTRAYRDYAYHNEHRLYAELLCPVDAGVLGFFGPGRALAAQDNNVAREG